MEPCDAETSTNWVFWHDVWRTTTTLAWCSRMRDTEGRGWGGNRQRAVLNGVTRHELVIPWNSLNLLTFPVISQKHLNWKVLHSKKKKKERKSSKETNIIEQCSFELQNSVYELKLWFVAWPVLLNLQRWFLKQQWALPFLKKIHYYVKIQTLRFPDYKHAG